jgi:hypothetical protein
LGGAFEDVRLVVRLWVGHTVQLRVHVIEPQQPHINRDRGCRRLLLGVDDELRPDTEMRGCVLNHQVAAQTRGLKIRRDASGRVSNGVWRRDEEIVIPDRHVVSKLQ